MFATVEHKIKTGAQRTALGLAGGLMLTAGLGFLTVAGWIALSLAADTLTAALVIGCAYLGLGLILFFLAARRASPTARAALDSPKAPPLSMGLVAAFLDGFGAGSAYRRSDASPRQ